MKLDKQFKSFEDALKEILEKEGIIYQEKELSEFNSIYEAIKYYEKRDGRRYW